MDHLANAIEMERRFNKETKRAARLSKKITKLENENGQLKMIIFSHVDPSDIPPRYDALVDKIAKKFS